MKRIAIALVFLFEACSPGPRLLDYISLPPPQRVRAQITPEGLLISWKLPPDYLLARIEQFNVYVSRKSLLYSPLRSLPEPACTAKKNQTRCLIRELPPWEHYFIHVRSQNPRGDLSLPSLPEIHLQPHRPSEK